MRWGRASAWYLDVTDAFFEGRGCALAIWVGQTRAVRLGDGLR